MKVLARLGAWLRTPYAAVVAFLILGAVTFLGFYQLELQQREAENVRREIVDTQQQINAEQRDRIASVCDALTESKNDLRNALETLIAISTEQGETDPARAARIELFRERAIKPLETPPPQCERLREPPPSLDMGG